jgi:hypothetical protein
MVIGGTGYAVFVLDHSGWWFALAILVSSMAYKPTRWIHGIKGEHMSGGHWNYLQSHMQNIADDLGELIHTNDWKGTNRYGDPIGNHYSPETIAEFEKAVKALRLAYVYAQRIDWLLSGDDGEDSCHIRLQAQLGELK